MRRSNDHGRRHRTARTLLTMGAALVFAVALSGCLEWTSDAAPDATAEPPAATPVSDQAVDATPAEARTYVVQRGDTLARIAAAEGVSLGDLVELNALANPDVIEVGDVILLEPAAVPLPDLARSIVAREPVDRNLGDHVRGWWNSLYRPDLQLSDRSLSQGAVAGLMLPAAVLAFIAVWLVWQGVQKVPLTVASASMRVLHGWRPQLGTAGGGTTEVANVDAPSSLKVTDRRGIRYGVGALLASLRAAGGRARRRIPRRLESRSLLPQIPRPHIRPPVNGGNLSRMAALPLRGISRVASSTGQVVTSTSQRIRGRQEDPGRAKAEALWVRGTELLRIGLLDEAYACFEEGRRLARTHGWAEEAERHLAALDDLATRRQGRG